MFRRLSVLIIALSSGLLLLPDLVHLPALIGHYIQHKEHSPEIDMMDFLVLHYVDKDHTKNGDSTHDQLPFHHRHSAGDNLPVMAIDMASSLLFATSPPVPTPVAHGEDDPLAGHRYGLIQPPRC